MKKRVPPKTVEAIPESKLHPRNRDRGRYDFPRLMEVDVELRDFVAVNALGDLSLDFANQAAVKALRAGERADKAKPAAGSGPKNTSSETMTLLNSALQDQLEVWIGYADKGGMTTERVIEPLSISGGFLSAFDVRSNEVRTFTVARITGVEVMNSKKKVAQND